MTLTEDLNLDGCVIKLMGAVLKVKSTATKSPVLTISNGGKLIVGESNTSKGVVKAVSSTYPLVEDMSQRYLRARS